MRNRFRFATLAGVLALAGHLLAGGFYLQLGNPEASAEARAANAVLTIRATGCPDPATAKMRGNAIGMVNGRSERIPLQFTPLSQPGWFALAQQWPREGKWVIELVGTAKKVGTADMVTHTLVTAGPEGVNRLHPKSSYQAFSAEAISAMLR